MVGLSATAGVDAVVATLNADGFAIVEGILSPVETRAKRDELTRILESTPTGRNNFEGFSTRRIYALFAKTRAFDEPAVHPLVLGVLDRVLVNYQLSAPVGIEIGPGEKAQSLHRDDGIYPIRLPHDELVVNTMWALDDFTEANGATHVVPGSHRRLLNPDHPSGFLTPEMEAEHAPKEHRIPLELESGEAVLLHNWLLHGSDVNRSGQSRRAFSVCYMDADTRLVKTGERASSTIVFPATCTAA